MKKILLFFLLLASVSSYAQITKMGGMATRVNDSTTYVNSSAVTTAHADGYADIWFSNASNLFWVWDGTSAYVNWDPTASSGGGATAAGATGNVQYKSAGGGLQAEAALSYDSATNTLTVPNIAYTPTGNISATTLHGAINELDQEKINQITTFRRLTASHSLDATDLASIAAGQDLVIEMNVGSANDLTVVANATQAFTIGTKISVTQYGAGATTIVQSGGVTVRSSSGSLILPGQYTVSVLEKVGTDEWYLWNGAPSVAVGQALTKVDDTNVTLTLGGTPATALVNPVSVTVVWSGTLGLSRGGTNADNTTQTYTPTLTNSANIAASTAQICQYYRVGNMVHVSGTLSIDPTTTATLTTMGISLPIASDFTTAVQCGGTAAATAVTDAAAGIISDATNNRATLQYMCVDVTNHVMSFSFMYQVL